MPSQHAYLCWTESGRDDEWCVVPAFTADEARKEATYLNGATQPEIKVKRLPGSIDRALWGLMADRTYKVRP